jgi:chorismate dehydratase
VVDLGLAWTKWTGLPFVYARWTARAGLPPAERTGLSAALDAAAVAGAARLPEIARARGPAHGLSPSEAERYLRDVLRFEIDDRAEAGLARFREEVSALTERL